MMAVHLNTRLLQIAVVFIATALTLNKVRVDDSPCNITALEVRDRAQCGGGAGYALRCNHTNLTSVPVSYPPPADNSSFKTLCLLDLSRNNLTVILNDSFSNVSGIYWLYLNQNQLLSIEPRAFEGLDKLLYLNLTDNRLRLPESFGSEIFKPLGKLLHLNMKVNNFSTFNGLDLALAPLTHLEGLFIDYCRNCTFDRGFTNLTNLTKLHLSGVVTGKCNKDLVTNDSFANVNQIKELYLSSCKIHSIEANAFAPLKRLEILDFSYNSNLEFCGMNTALYGLRNSTSLRELNVNKIHSFYGRGTILNANHVENLSTLRNLTILHMDLNKLEVFDEKVFNPYKFPTSLRNMTLSGNRLTYDKYTKYVYFAKDLLLLDISRQHLNYDPFYFNHFVSSTKNDLLFKPIDIICAFCGKDAPSSISPICLPKNVAKMKWRKSFLVAEIPLLVICGAEKLVSFDLSFNLLTSWHGPIYGLENLKHLDLSENYCHNFNEMNFFSSFPNLTSLNLRGNHIGHVFNKASSNTTKLFRKQRKLRYLDLSSNDIARLPQNIFSPMHSLRILNLTNNKIESWDVELKNSRCLKVLDISSNKLEMLPEHLRKELDSIASEPCNKRVNVSVYMKYNPVECTCHTLPFLKWIRDTKVAIHMSNKDQCHLKNGGRQPVSLEEVIEILETDCKDYTWLVITLAVVGACIASTCVCIGIYKNRWKLRYFFYIKKNRRHVNSGYDRIFEKDAFVSYSSSEAVFIKRSLVPALENDHGLNVWVADRDSVAGVSIAENIAHGISSSRKSVLLFTRDYMKDDWCDYEMNIARLEAVESKRKVLIVVQMEDIPAKDIPLSVMKIFKKETVLEFPSETQDAATFWKSLADEIMS